MLAWRPTIAEIQMAIQTFGVSPPILLTCLADEDGASVIRSTQRLPRKHATPSLLIHSSTPRPVTPNLTRAKDAGRSHTTMSLLLIVIVTHRARHADSQMHQAEQMNASVVQMIPIYLRRQMIRKTKEHVKRPIRLRRLQGAGKLLTP